jgi:hypothetical protein
MFATRLVDRKRQGRLMELLAYHRALGALGEARDRDPTGAWLLVAVRTVSDSRPSCSTLSVVTETTW